MPALTIKNILSKPRTNKMIWLPLLMLIIFSFNLTAQTTGKLAGRITDESGEPLVGANVVIVGATHQGAATDLDGYYSILNLRAGIYTVRFGYIGYQSKLIENIKLNSDQTTRINVQLQIMVIEGEEVTITAERPLVEFNQTSSVSSISKEEINLLPVQDLNQIVNLQAGVIDGHFRGGRIGEVQYQVDGVTVNNPFNNSSTLLLDKSVLQEVQVISGTFDAKYGQAMSGVVNAVLRTGSDKFEFSGEVYGGDYLPFDNQRYPNNKDFNPITLHNFQLTLSGPTYLPQTTFLLSGRRYYGNGWLYGERRFVPTDSNDLDNKIFYPSGDNESVPMSTTREWSGQFKITNTSISNVQLSYQAILNRIVNKYYNFGLRLNPDGVKPNNTNSLTHGIDVTQTISNEMFYKVSLRQNFFDYKSYMYESVFDPRYLDAGEFKSESNYEDGAIVQGVDLGRYLQKTNSFVAKSDFTWQLNRNNLIELGLEGQLAEISFGSPGFITTTNIAGTRVLVAKDKPEKIEDPKLETYHPKQFAAYFQDRIEMGDLVVRAGLRLEYYDANAFIPDDLQNPANSISGSPNSELKKTTVKIALAPRLGFSFPLTDRASIYFAYGHFYQMPGLADLYSNSNYLILKDLQDGGISYGTMGNPDLKPQLTVQYEVGLKQALSALIGYELTFFYKDIRDLLGSEFISTYAAADYPRLTNVDFGSVYGITIALTQRAFGPLSTTLDYTMQFARGNSSDPYETANRAASGKDSRPRDISFGWDQRHTINATATWIAPGDYSISTIVRYGSGMPYTPAKGTGFNADLETNSGSKTGFVLVDLRAEKSFSLSLLDMSAFLRITNLLNTHFVNGFIFSETGSPDYSVNPLADRAALANPGRFHEPRKIELGISFRSK
jgi:outer membrane receptor protein involved in Fe transport